MLYKSYLFLLLLLCGGGGEGGGGVRESVSCYDGPVGANRI